MNPCKKATILFLSPKRGLAIAVTMFAVLFCGPATADYAVDYVFVHCDSSHRQVTVNYAEIEDEDEGQQSPEDRKKAPYKPSAPDFVLKENGEDGRCLWSDGTRILVRYGVGEALPYGMGGADPAGWVSVWVGQAKWVERALLGGFMPTSGLRTTKLSIMPHGLTTCTIETPASFSGEKQGRQVCTKTAKRKLPASADLREFPVHGQERPKPFTTVVRQSSNPELCRALIPSPDTSYDNIGSYMIRLKLPNGGAIFGEANDVPHPARTEVAYEIDKLTAPQLFDIDNSGRSSWVFSTHDESHAHDADVYYLYDATGLEKLASSKQTLDDLLNDAAYVYPCSWIDNRNEKLANDNGLSENTCLLDGDLPFSMTDYDGKAIVWRSRYLHILPFSYQNATFLLLTTMDQEVNHVAFVVRPGPKGAYEIACTLESIRPNF